MTDETDLEPLIDGPLYPFRDFRKAPVPRNIAGVYTVWDEEGRFVYVGIGGTTIRYREPDDESEPSAPVKGLWGRLDQHYSGDRGSDRFCLVVFDTFVLPGLTEEQRSTDSPSALHMNHLTRDWIREHFGFRFIQVSDGKRAAVIETAIRRGTLPVGKPYLNPLD